MKEFMTGNEAIARGAYEAGVHFASAYPGTPSTEIVENLQQYGPVKAEWAPNEKVAMESAIGASIAGGRSFAAMKMVGVNVAADPLFTYAYMGVNGGFVFVSADDPGQFSSQNEQDNRNYAKFARVAMFEPSDSQECKDMMIEAYEVSEKYNTTVMMRMTTRIDHGKSLVELGERKEVPMKEYTREMGNTTFIALPAKTRLLRPKLDEKFAKLAEYSENTPFNREEWNDSDIGIITSGISYQYSKEVFGDKANYLKLGFTNPIPMKKIKEFADKVDTLYVIEELDPYIERQLKEEGIECIGKEKLPDRGELSTNIIAEALLGEKTEKIEVDQEKLVGRPPTLCAGCPHRGFFYELGKIKNAVVTGDIGCYTLGAAPPLAAMDTCICMGGSAGTGYGAQRIFDYADIDKRAIAVMGDSTFFHTGINGILNAIYNGGRLITCVLDNRTTAMTGHQDNPGTGQTAHGDVTQVIDIEEVVRALGCEHVRTINPHDLDEVREAFDWAMGLDEPSVIITRYPCALKKYSDIDMEEFGPLDRKFYVDQDDCIGCKKCTKTGCPAIHFQFDINKSSINPAQCVGCSVCAQVCPVDAIKVKEDK